MIAPRSTLLHGWAGWRWDPGRRRGVTPSLIQRPPPCRSKPMPIAATTFPNSDIGSPTGRDYDAALCQRGSLTIWFTDAAIAAWQAEPRTTPGGQPYSARAILRALTLRAVFRL